MAEEDLKRLIENSAAETRKHLEIRFEALDQKIEALDQKIEALDQEIEALDQKIDGTRRHFEIIGENLDNKIQVVAEVLNGKIDGLRDDMNRRFTDVDRQFLDTQAMIKFSHSELDRRIRALEGSVSDLEARVERLEGSNRPS